MKPWNNQKIAYQKALNYIYGRQQGTIYSFKTPWSKVNDAGAEGWEWHSMNVIAGRPGTGKTLIKDQIIREAFKHNAGLPINFLEFQLEMVAQASKVREFCAVLEKPYKYVCSAGKQNKLSSADFNKLYQYSKEAIDINNYPVDIVENPCTVTTFGDIIEAYMEEHSQIIEGQKLYTNTIVSLDHSLLLKTEKKQSKTDMLYSLGERATQLKRKYPIVFIILSQLGRHVETPERNENGKYGNYILETDIFGGDALMQHADMVIGINRPAMKYIEFYGPDRYIIGSDSTLVFHFIKCRNGDTRMSFFNAEFDKMSISEMATPGQQQQRIKTN